MKCPYCGRDVVPNGLNCPKCKAAIVKKEPAKPVSTEINKEVK